MTDSDDKLIDSMLEYAVIGSEVADINELRKLVTQILSPQHGEKVMTLGQRLYEEGIDKGVQKGQDKSMAEVARKLILEGAELAFITRITGLPVERIKEMMDEALD